MSDANQPVEVLCRYLVKPGKDVEFAAILARHWNVLHGLGLTTDDPARLHRGTDKAGNVAFFEQFSWKTGGSSDTAHESPDVMRLWEPMGMLCRDMEFWHVQAVGQ